jgi:hypothetical protein
LPSTLSTPKKELVDGEEEKGEGEGAAAGTGAGRGFDVEKGLEKSEVLNEDV